jgi:ribonuclease-3
VSREEDHEALEEKLGHRFTSRVLLERALTHSSSASRPGADNETYEFLGDAVVGLVVSDLLLEAWPDADEGKLSRRRAALVNARVLAEKAAELGMGSILSMGRGEEKTGGRAKRSILAAALEAVIGAIFLDGGYEAAHAVGRALFASDLHADAEVDESEAKTRLQELTQRIYRTAPEYELVGVSGPDHARAFETRVLLRGRQLGAGSGASKKLAEQAAARAALRSLESGEIDLEERAKQGTS